MTLSLLHRLAHRLLGWAVIARDIVLLLIVSALSAALLIVTGVVALAVAVAPVFALVFVVVAAWYLASGLFQ
jgi:hypothetical protein